VTQKRIMGTLCQKVSLFQRQCSDTLNVWWCR